jgi:hypothetical protein
VSETVIIGSWSIGAAFSFSPNFQQGLMAADRIFALLRRVPEVKNVSQPLYLHRNDVSNIVQQYLLFFTTLQLKLASKTYFTTEFKLLPLLIIKMH